jgi:signal transduction histidine kinase/ActR/RegA family two-component response regulator
MQRLSIARSLRLALIGLTLILAAIAALGVASLYSSRQSYEDTLLNSSQLASAAANLATASVVVETVAGQVHGTPTAAQRQTALAYRSAERRALALARGDPASRRLIDREVAASSATGALTAAGRVQDRQTQRQRQAQVRARSRSRRALVVIVAAGVIALLGALALVALLIRSMRRPLDELVAATRAMAAGDLQRRVLPDGPRELRQLSEAFNLMGDDLEGARGRLERERSKLATTIASLGDGLIVTEPGSSQIATVNARAAELLPSLAPGTAVDAEPDLLPPLHQLIDRELTVEHRGRTLAVSGAAVRNDEGGDGAVLTVRDMTEWARLDRAKSEFIATASHELRSPLTSIKGFVELLAGSPQGMSERQQEFVSIILRSTDRLVDLVSDLLDVARFEAAQVEIRPRAVDVGELVGELAELIGPRVEAKHQSLSLEVPPALPLALADPSRLRQIVQNLLTNAHLYTPEGGRLLLSADARAGLVRVSVADTGPGMTPEQLAHVYERFYRAHDDHGAPGTGLGLTIVKSLVDLHGGKIEVASEVGRGTTFRVSIPVADTTTEGLMPALEALRGRLVLIVDDERDLARLIADQLAPFDVSTVVAASGPEALELLRRQRFDAITMDVRMPEMDGVELLGQIRADAELAGIPVVFVSVSTNMAELDGEWIVSKPIDADELRQVLGTAVSMGRSRVLVVAREELRAVLEPSLDALDIPYHWAASGVAAARACSERLFEVALVDVGLSNPQAVLAALTLRGRRQRRAVILFDDGSAPPGSEAAQLGLEVVPITAAAGALSEALGHPMGPPSAENPEIDR